MRNRPGEGDTRVRPARTLGDPHGGPVWAGGAAANRHLLRLAVTSPCWRAPTRSALHRIAIPAISTGIYGYPSDQPRRSRSTPSGPPPRPSVSFDSCASTPRARRRTSEPSPASLEPLLGPRRWHSSPAIAQALRRSARCRIATGYRYSIPMCVASNSSKNVGSMRWTRSASTNACAPRSRKNSSRVPAST